MREVRKTLELILGAQDNPTVSGKADEILAWFDVTPKPVPTNEELGLMVRDAYPSATFTMEYAGERLREGLAKRGLTIVRAEGEAE